MGVLDASRFQLVMCWKRFCGFSTQVRNGTCCRKLSELQNCASTLSNLVLPRDFASGFDGRCQRAS